jgi:hypothetical protein
MAQTNNPNAWTDGEKAQIRQIFRYGAWIFSAIIVALIVASILSATFNLEGGAGTATSTLPADTPTATQPPS